jgi:hypothetical protein
LPPLVTRDGGGHDRRPHLVVTDPGLQREDGDAAARTAIIAVERRRFLRR